MCGLTYIAEAVEDACSFLISRGCSLEARNYTARGVQSYDCNPVPYYCSTLNIDGCYDIDGCSWIGQPPPPRPPPPKPTPTPTPTPIYLPPLPSPPPPVQVTPAAQAVNDATSSSSSSTSTGAIVGGVIGGLVVVAAIAAIFIVWRKHQRQQDKDQILGGGKTVNGGWPMTLPSANPPAPSTYISSMPTNTYLSSIAAPILSSNLEVIARDPLLSWATSTAAKHQRQGPSRSPSSVGASSAAEINFLDLTGWQRVGHGSFGIVYKAIYNHTPVAVKVLGSQDSAQQTDAVNAALLAELEKEAGLMASPAFRHPNIVQILGISLHPPAIITEFCERGSLTHALQEAKASPSIANELTWARVISMALDASRGMLHLHTRSPPIIHRDLKSPNLLVDQSWHVKVADFNLSKTVSEGSLTSVVGTASLGGPTNPRWLAPELMEEGAKATAAADTFAFGVVLWELLAWDIPWTGVADFRIFGAVLDGQRLQLPLENLLPGPGGPRYGFDKYVTLMHSCWDQNPAGRPTFEIITAGLGEIAAAIP